MLKSCHSEIILKHCIFLHVAPPKDMQIAKELYDIFDRNLELLTHAFLNLFGEFQVGLSGRIFTFYKICSCVKYLARVA